MRTIVETSKGYVLIDTCDTADHGLETMVFRCQKICNRTRSRKRSFRYD